MNPVDARGLVPPRPNLGPEPWSDPDPDRALPLGRGGPGISALHLARAEKVRRVRRRRGPGATSRTSASETQRLGADWSRIPIRSETAWPINSGTAWRAKTTEELAAEPRLAEALGFDQLQELIRFLDQVDRLKFAPERSNHHHDSLEHELAAWEPRIAELREEAHRNQFVFDIVLSKSHAQNVSLEWSDS